MSDPQATDVETPADTAPQQSTQQSTAVGEPSEATVPADETGPEAPRLEDAPGSADLGDDTVGEPGGGPAADRSDKGEKKSRVRQLEREGEVAADFLETLLDIADLDGDIDVDVDGDRAAIAIVDSDEGRVPRRLVGTEGKVLEALQELTRLAVQAQTGERSRLMLDVAGYRAERRSALVELAQAAIAEVSDSGTKRSLDPMTAFERKVVHDEVAAAGLVSESEGAEPHRHVVILPE
jgi:spoIIIJ-associated protein